MTTIVFGTSNERIARKHLEQSNYSEEAKDKIVEWAKNGWIKVCDPMMYGRGQLAFLEHEPFKKMYPDAKSDYDACYQAVMDL